jgi:hypothetical protein
MTNLLNKKKFLQPPRLAERLLASILTPDDAEAVLGDFAELFNTNAYQSNLQKAQFWYWIQTFKSAPSLIRLKLSNELERRMETMIKNLNLHNKSSLWVSLIALIPALLLVIPGIMQSGLGYLGPNDALDTMFAKAPALQILLSPIVLLGGLLLAFILNLTPAIKLRFERQPEGLTSVITFKPVILHWIFVGISLLIVSIILVYAFFENFVPAVQ